MILIIPLCRVDFLFLPELAESFNPVQTTQFICRNA